MSAEPLQDYKVWDAPTRWFHWINVLTVLILALSGFFFMYRKVFLIESIDAKMALKAGHSIVGYVFATNLLVRIVWGFCGNRLARWPAVLPNRESLGRLGGEIRALLDRRPYDFVGRSSLSRISATVMFVLLIALAGTGLFRASTDLLYPPIGPLVAAFVALPEVDPWEMTWRDLGDESKTDSHRFRLVNGAKGITGKIHYYGSYLLLFWIVLHIAGVTMTEVRQRSGVVSAMFSGRKWLATRPVDADEIEEGQRK